MDGSTGFALKIVSHGHKEKDMGKYFYYQGFTAISAAHLGEKYVYEIATSTEVP